MVFKKYNMVFKKYKMYITSSTFSAVNVQIVRIAVGHNTFWTGS